MTGAVMEITLQANGHTLCEFDIRLVPEIAPQRQIVGIEVPDLDDNLDVELDPGTWADTSMDLETWWYGSDDSRSLYVLRAFKGCLSEVQVTRRLVWPGNRHQLLFGCKRQSSVPR